MASLPFVVGPAAWFHHPATAHDLNTGGSSAGMATAFLSTCTARMQPGGTCAEARASCLLCRARRFRGSWGAGPSPEGSPAALAASPGLAGPGNGPVLLPLLPLWG